MYWYLLSVPFFTVSVALIVFGWQCSKDEKAMKDKLTLEYNTYL